MISWILHTFGMDDGSGAWYLFWSGIVGDIPVRVGDYVNSSTKLTTIDQLGEVHDTLSLTYTVPVLTDPAARELVLTSDGAYRDYVRVYLPEPAHLDGMTLATAGRTAQVTPEAVTYEADRFVVLVTPEPDGSGVPLAVR